MVAHNPKAFVSKVGKLADMEEEVETSTRVQLAMQDAERQYGVYAVGGVVVRGMEEHADAFFAGSEHAEERLMESCESLKISIRRSDLDQLGMYYMPRVHGDLRFGRAALGWAEETTQRFVNACAGLQNLFNGLKRLHKAGWVHMDIKEANAGVLKVDKYVLMDWGMARPLALRNMRFLLHHSSFYFAHPPVFTAIAKELLITTRSVYFPDVTASVLVERVLRNLHDASEKIRGRAERWFSNPPHILNTFLDRTRAQQYLHELFAQFGDFVPGGDALAWTNNLLRYVDVYSATRMARNVLWSMVPPSDLAYWYTLNRLDKLLLSCTAGEKIEQVQSVLEFAAREATASQPTSYSPDTENKRSKSPRLRQRSSPKKKRESTKR
jgi:hypothetical protein